MKKSFLILTGVAAGVALRPYLERKAPAVFELCERKMCEIKGCECVCHKTEEEPKAEVEEPMLEAEPV